MADKQKQEPTSDLYKDQVDYLMGRFGLSRQAAEDELEKQEPETSPE